MSMLTIDKIIEFIERTIAEYYLSGNRVGLKNTQDAARSSSCKTKQGLGA
jgi:hypothetical protein